MENIRQMIFLNWIKKSAKNNGQIYYIGGSDVLPAPLETEEENKMIMDLGTESETETIVLDPAPSPVDPVACKRPRGDLLPVEDRRQGGTLQGSG